jgi:general secretion pathway protein D
VIVDDGSIVVLGGLLQDEYSGNQDKVPGAGDIPILGALFRNESRSRKKTNLMVFLRPVVVRDSASSDNLTIERYQAMRAMQEAVLPKSSKIDEVPANVPGALPVAPFPRMPLSIFSNNETPSLPGGKKP